MKIKSESFILWISLLLSANMVAAQRGQWNSDPAERARQQTAEMTEKLALSTKQAEKVGEINLKYASKMNEARENNPEGDWSAMRETMATIRQEQNAAYKKVLTTAQFEQWEQIQEERLRQMQERRRERTPRDKSQKPPENKG